jgi:hypothetical protein
LCFCRAAEGDICVHTWGVHRSKPVLGPAPGQPAVTAGAPAQAAQLHGTDLADEVLPVDLSIQQQHLAGQAPQSHTLRVHSTTHGVAVSCFLLRHQTVRAVLLTWLLCTLLACVVTLRLTAADTALAAAVLTLTASLRGASCQFLQDRTTPQICEPSLSRAVLAYECQTACTACHAGSNSVLGSPLHF